MTLNIHIAATGVVVFMWALLSPSTFGAWLGTIIKAAQVAMNAG